MERISQFKPLLIAMVGLPRSGKSTIAAQLRNLYGYPVVSRDALRLVMHGQRYAIEAEPMVKAVSRYMIGALFGAGHMTVLCDETNYSQAAREALQDDKWRVEFYEVTTSKEVCQERALATNQADLVPVIEAMAARYEPLEDHEVKYVR